jgi:beta-lactamase regulating signal transducer with metallopeptidase domain
MFSKLDRFDPLTLVVALGALALVIMSAVSLGSINTLKKNAKVSPIVSGTTADSGAKTAADNVSRVAMLLLVVSAVVLVVYGFDLYKQYGAGKQASSVSYYF